MNTRLAIEFSDFETMIRWIADLKGLDTNEILVPHKLGIMSFGPDGPDPDSNIYWFCDENGVRGGISATTA